MRQLSIMNVHGAQFGTSMQAWNRLARVEDATGVQLALDVVELGQFRRLELVTHLIDLFNTHTMLSGNGTATVHAQCQDIATEFFCFVQIAGLVGIVQDQRVQVAIAGMKYVGAW